MIIDGVNHRPPAPLSTFQLLKDEGVLISGMAIYRERVERKNQGKGKYGGRGEEEKNDADRVECSR